MTQAISSNGYSTRYEDHVGMLHRLAKRAFGTVCQTPVKADYEDIYGMMLLSFVKAQQTYDPEQGFTFSAYYGRSCWNNFLKWMNGEVKRTTAIGYVSVEELGGSDDDTADIWDSLSDKQAQSPEEIVMGRKERSEALRGLSRSAKIVMRELLSPSEQVLAALAQHNDDIASGRQSGRPLDDVTIPLICRTLKLKGARADIRRELAKALQVTL